MLAKCWHPIETHWLSHNVCYLFCLTASQPGSSPRAWVQGERPTLETETKTQRDRQRTDARHFNSFSFCISQQKSQCTQRLISDRGAVGFCRWKNHDTQSATKLTVVRTSCTEICWVTHSPLCGCVWSDLFVQNQINNVVLLWTSDDFSELQITRLALLWSALHNCIPN